MVAAVDNARTALSPQNEMSATASRLSKTKAEVPARRAANATGHPPEPGNSARQRASDQVTQMVGTTLGGRIASAKTIPRAWPCSRTANSATWATAPTRALMPTRNVRAVGTSVSSMPASTGRAGGGCAAALSAAHRRDQIAEVGMRPTRVRSSRTMPWPISVAIRSRMSARSSVSSWASADVAARTNSVVPDQPLGHAARAQRCRRRRACSSRTRGTPARGRSRRGGPAPRRPDPRCGWAPAPRDAADRAPGDAGTDTRAPAGRSPSMQDTDRASRIAT